MLGSRNASNSSSTNEPAAASSASPAKTSVIWFGSAVLLGRATDGWSVWAGLGVRAKQGINPFAQRRVPGTSRVQVGRAPRQGSSASRRPERWSLRS